MLEHNVICDDDKKIAEIFNHFFSNVVHNLHIDTEEHLIDGKSECDPILKAIKRYEKHPSILKILAKGNKKETFSFQPTNTEAVTTEILSLNLTGATPKDSIPPHVLMQNCDLFGYIPLISIFLSVLGCFQIIKNM